MARNSRLTDVAVAYAANLRGDGVAYLSAGEAEPIRVPFRVQRHPALLGREIGYAALAAAATALRARGLRAVRLIVDDERVVEDLGERRELPLALALPYVRLRCTLNTLRRATVVPGPVDQGLVARARAEVELAVAA